MRGSSSSLSSRFVVQYDPTILIFCWLSFGGSLIIDNEELSFDNSKSTIHNDDDDDDTERSWTTTSESDNGTTHTMTSSTTTNKSTTCNHNIHRKSKTNDSSTMNHHQPLSGYTDWSVSQCIWVELDHSKCGSVFIECHQLGSVAQGAPVGTQNSLLQSVGTYGQ